MSAPGTATCAMCGEAVRGVAATGGPAYCDEVCAQGAGVEPDAPNVGTKPRLDLVVVAASGAMELRDLAGTTTIQERLTAAGFRPGDRVSIVLTAAVEVRTMTQATLFDAPTKSATPDVSTDGITASAVHRMVSSLVPSGKVGGGFNGWYWQWFMAEVTGDVSKDPRDGCRWYKLSCRHPDGRKQVVKAPTHCSSLKPDAVRAFIAAAAIVTERTEDDIAAQLRAYATDPETRQVP